MFEEFVKVQPLLSMILFSFVITTLLTFVYKILTKQEELKKIKEQSKELQAKLKTEQNTEKQLELQKKMLELSGEMMKHSMKPMLITTLPLLIIFVWLRNLYTNAKIGDIISWGVKLPIVGTGAGWLLCYIIFSLVFSITLRKIFKVH